MARDATPEGSGSHAELGATGASSASAEPGAKGASPASALAEDWRTQLDEELRHAETLKKIKSVKELARSYVSLEKLLSHEKVPLPKDEDDKEGWDRVYRTLGRPDAPEMYEFERPDLPDGMTWDEESEKFWRNWAHANGISQRQFQRLMETGVQQRLEAHASAVDAQRRYAEERDARIKRELGDRFETYKTSARAVLARYGDEDLMAWLEETKSGDDPRVIKLFGRIGMDMMGDTALKKPGRETQGPADWDAQINAYRKRYAKALSSRDDPMHDHHVNELRKLYERKHQEL